MTLGERIAQKRKELGLSQEALGEKLGVSRQAIYKWESDATLPEVEKLVALSGLFGVSVGWLLGTEEGETAAEELTEKQLKMVEEIVGRYLPAKPKRRRWPWVVAGLALCLLMANFYQRLEDLTQQSKNLQYAVGRVEDTVDRQIWDISRQVEDTLKAQNDLTNDFGADFVSVDLGENTITFDLHALPKTYVPGMETRFLVDCGEAEPLELPAQRGEDGVYRARATLPLPDTWEGIPLSVMLLSPDGTRATQVSEISGYCRSYTFPRIDLDDDLIYHEIRNLGKIKLTALDRIIKWSERPAEPFGDETPAQVEEIRVGLFQNGKLLFWATPVETEPSTASDPFGMEEAELHYVDFPSDVTFSGALEDRLTIVAIARDSYGRIFTQKGHTFEIQMDSIWKSWLIWSNETDTADTDPLTWDYPKDGDGWPTE